MRLMMLDIHKRIGCALPRRYLAAEDPAVQGDLSQRSQGPFWKDPLLRHGDVQRASEWLTEEGESRATFRWCCANCTSNKRSRPMLAGFPSPTSKTARGSPSMRDPAKALGGGAHCVGIPQQPVGLAPLILPVGKQGMCTSEIPTGREGCSGPNECWSTG